MNNETTPQLYTSVFAIGSNTDMELGMQTLQELLDSYAGHSIVNNNLELITLTKLTVDDEVFVYNLITSEITVASNLRSSVKKSLENAMIFGNALIVNFSTDSIMLGIVQLGVTDQVIEVTSKAMNAIKTGSLHLALDEIRIIPIPDIYSKLYTIINPERLLKVRNQIEKYLGLPLAQDYRE